MEKEHGNEDLLECAPGTRSETKCPSRDRDGRAGKRNLEKRVGFCCGKYGGVCTDRGFG